MSKKSNKNNVVKIPKTMKMPILEPRNDSQKNMIKSIQRNIVTFAIGSAGSGKTYVSVMSALSAFLNKEVRKIVITRPVISANDEKIGYLPGEIKDKLDPFLRPVLDAFEEYWSPQTIKDRINDGSIEIAPMGFMRGRSFNDCFIIIDEAQNATKEGLLMALTRIGEGSKVVITGDPTQSDINRNDLEEVCGILDSIEDIEIIKFSNKDVVRSKIVKDILEAWEVNN